MTIESRIRKANRIIRQLLDIPCRSESENAELAWWYRQLGSLEARRLQA